MKFSELQSYNSNPNLIPNPVCIHYKYTQSLQIHAQMYVCAVVCLVAQLCPTLCNPMNFSLPGSSVHGDSPSKNNEVGCRALPQRIFSTQGLKLGLLHCNQNLYHLSHQGRPVLSP